MIGRVPKVSDCSRYHPDKATYMDYNGRGELHYLTIPGDYHLSDTLTIKSAIFLAPALMRFRKT